MCCIYKVTASGCDNEALCQVMFVFPNVVEEKNGLSRTGGCLSLGLIVKPLGLLMVLAKRSIPITIAHICRFKM